MDHYYVGLRTAKKSFYGVDVDAFDNAEENLSKVCHRQRWLSLGRKFSSRLGEDGNITVIWYLNIKYKKYITVEMFALNIIYK